MANSRIATSSITQGFPKSKSLLAGNDAIYAGSYDSIASVTVGSGGSASVVFSSIPSTYSHLQVRGFVRSSRGSTYDVFFLRFNGDSSVSNYTEHQLEGTGAAVNSSGTATGLNSGAWLGYLPASTNTANVFGVGIVDILDYSNTNKYKTSRSLAGVDTNGAGYSNFYSSLWVNTAAINSITVVALNGNISQYSSIALYGIK